MNSLEESPETAKEFDLLLKELATQFNINDVANPTAPSKPAAKPVPTKETADAAGSKDKPSFQDTINQTMNRLKESKQEIDESVLSGADEDMMTKLMGELANLGQGDGGLDLANMVNDLLSQIASKEVLYEPMKEMDENFDNWLKENKPKLSSEDYEKYVSQRKATREIVKTFESPDYDDNNAEMRKKVTTQMELLQSYGGPPRELMSGLPDDPLKELGELGLPDLSDFNPEDMPDMENCQQQ